MKIATWNVNSINVRMPQLLEWLERAKPDVVCLQETKSVDANFPEFELKAAGYDAAFIGEKSYNGVAILSRLPIDNVQLNFPDDGAEAPKRLIAATIGGIRIVNTYIPNGTEIGSDKFAFKLDWLVRLRRYFDATCSPDDDVLLCGDFNVAPEPIDVWNPAAWEGKLHFSKPERAAITFVKQWGFSDLFRELNGPEPFSTTTACGSIIFGPRENSPPAALPASSTARRASSKNPATTLRSLRNSTLELSQ